MGKVFIAPILRLKGIVLAAWASAGTEQTTGLTDPTVLRGLQRRQSLSGLYQLIQIQNSGSDKKRDVLSTVCGVRGGG